MADRATIGNMAPEYGATCGIFPIDRETIRYLNLSGRSAETVALVESYAKEQGMWSEDGAQMADYTEVVELDISTIEPSLAGPKRPQDRVALKDVKAVFTHNLQAHLNKHCGIAEERFKNEGGGVAIGGSIDSKRGSVEVELNDEKTLLKHGAVVIAAITSCTNTSNPAVLVAAALLAKKAHVRGLTVKPWVKTSFAPGSQVVPAYLEKMGLMDSLNALGFNIIGFGCTTCIGNSGPLLKPVSQAINDGNLMVASVLSGNRNFEGRIHAEVQTNWLTSPPLVIAYALAGNMMIDLATEPLGQDKKGEDIFLKDIWPTAMEVSQAIDTHINRTLFQEHYSRVFTGDSYWQGIETATSQNYDWAPSTYIAHPPYFQGMSMEKCQISNIVDAHCLVMVGNSITTDHISPAGAIQPDSPAGEHLQAQGVKLKDFNSYGSRRGNHEVMIRGTFANVRLHNKIAPGTEGGWTTHIPSNEVMSIFEAAERYRKEATPLIILAGKEYGTGSSRDWAAKGVNLLGVKAVIAESFERIHRSNLVGFGVLPLQFISGENADSLGLTGREKFSISLSGNNVKNITVIAKGDDNKEIMFSTVVRIDTPKERDYFRNGGILHYVLRNLARQFPATT